MYRLPHTLHTRTLHTSVLRVLFHDAVGSLTLALNTSRPNKTRRACTVRISSFGSSSPSTSVASMSPQGRSPVRRRRSPCTCCAAARARRSCCRRSPCTCCAAARARRSYCRPAAVLATVALPPVLAEAAAAALLALAAPPPVLADAAAATLLAIAEPPPVLAEAADAALLALVAPPPVLADAAAAALLAPVAEPSMRTGHVARNLHYDCLSSSRSCPSPARLASRR